ncbi:septal ring lytic transglycosylase RlpA family protein [Piscinibacter sp. HJYY11]|uniref:septal ring lytic transglycosylase RlpA family protein n=1 Tax=Piscinibacter sp. HJYY11 TaxID=2801333 RepID=UPI00191DB3C4|nr:septal ring lytic transglycosylase RlpA family protein [Piscinibacter sp. HJYY11]MBL0729217.1 septal ring lytic transglycosylase RlpA family protein [Piscinibacter sp. HJYY11]
MTRPLLFPWLLACVLALAACSSTPTRDGPEAKPPAGLDKTPDAQPRVEPIRTGGPNKPYEVNGRSYTPVATDRPMVEKGLASWYGRKFHGRPTASGERYDMYAMTAAHKTMPLPSYARVRNPANGREVIVRVNDRGPFHEGRIIDLSYTAAMRLGVLNGVAPVEVERLTHEQIRSGAWKAGAAVELPAAAAVEVAARQDSSPAAATPPREAPAPGFWVQLGAFRERGGAEQLQRQVADELDWLQPLLAVWGEPQLFRVQAGPFVSRTEAQDAASRIREAFKLVPVIVERR